MTTLDQLLDQAAIDNHIEQMVNKAEEESREAVAIAHLQEKMLKLGFTPEICQALEIEWRFDHGAEAWVMAFNARVRIFDTTYAGGGWWVRRARDGHDIHFERGGEKILNAVMLYLLGLRRAYKEHGL